MKEEGDFTAQPAILNPMTSTLLTPLTSELST